MLGQALPLGFRCRRDWRRARTWRPERADNLEERKRSSSENPFRWTLFPSQNRRPCEANPFGSVNRPDPFETRKKCSKSGLLISVIRQNVPQALHGVLQTLRRRGYFDVVGYVASWRPITTIRLLGDSDFVTQSFSAKASCGCFVLTKMQSV